MRELTKAEGLSLKAEGYKMDEGGRMKEECQSLMAEGLGLKLLCTLFQLFVQLLTPSHEDLHKFLTIFIQTIELDICQIIVSIQ